MTAVLTAPVPRAPEVARSRSMPLVVHLVLAAIALVVISVASHTGNRPWTADEGLYSAQARLLREGTWQAPPPPVNVDLKWRAMEKAEAIGGHIFPYTKHPLYSETLAYSTRLLGEPIGLHAPQVVAVLVTAWCAAILATRWNRRAGPLALWLTVASPMSVNAVVVWAHALGAAAAAVATLLLVDVWQGRRSSRWLALAGVAIAVGALFRSELLLFALAAIAAQLVADRRGGWRRSVTGAAMLGFPVAVAVVLEQRWIRSIVGVSNSNTVSRAQHENFVMGRLTGALRTAVGPLEPRAVLWVAVFVAGAALLGGWVGRQRDQSLLPVLLMLTAVVMLWRVGWASNIELEGLLVAWPVAVVGVAVFPRRSASAVPLAVLAAVFTVLVLATQYSEAGGLEWGARFLSPLIGPAAAVAAVGLCGLKLRSTARGALVALALVPVLAGVVMTAQVRNGKDAVAAELSEVAPRGVVATDLFLVSQQLWDQEISTRMLSAAPGELPQLLADLRNAGVSEVTVLTELSRSRQDWGAAQVTVIWAPEIESQGGVLLHVDLR